MTTFFTSDTHFWHYNVISYSGRKIYDDLPAGSVPTFKSRAEICEDMNNLLINNWNRVVKPNDTIFHLGDFAFCGRTKAEEIIQRLHGIKYWIRGNHDHELAKKLVHHFIWVRDYYVYRHHDQIQSDDYQDGTQYHQPIVLCHFPIESWENMSHGSWHLHGHSHGRLDSGTKKRYDVGVDPNNLYPVSYEQIKEVMKTRINIVRPEAE